MDEKKSPFAYGIQICYSNATTMHKEDCPNLDPEQIMAIDCTYVYWTRSKERLFFLQQQENGGLLATNNLAVPKELYALRKQKNDDDITLLLLLLGRLGAILPPLKKIGGEELLLLQLFLAAPGQSPFLVFEECFY